MGSVGEGELELALEEAEGEEARGVGEMMVD